MSTLASATTSRRTRKAASPWHVLPWILLGTFLSQSSYFVVNVALPSIAQSLKADNSMLQLITAAYSVSYAGLLVAAGRLGDRYGRRRFFVIGLSVFAVASIISAIAPNGWALAGGRLAQGIAAGMIVPQVLGTISATFDGQSRARAIGFFAATAGTASVIGQLLGGLATSADPQNGWRWLFGAFGPAAVVVAVVGRRLIPETKGALLKVDGVGAVGLTVALTLIIVPLSVGRSAGWPLWTWLSMAAGILAGIGLFLDQRRRERAGKVPLIPPSLFKIAPFRRGLIAVALYFLALGGFFLTTALTMQQGLGMSTLTSSIVLAPYATAFLLGSIWTPRLVQRFGVRVLTFGGYALAAAYLIVGVVAWLDYSQLTPLALAVLLVPVGVTQALVMNPLTSGVLGQLPPERAGFAAGVFSTTQQAAVALGVGILGTVFFSYAGGPTGSSGWRDATVAVFLLSGLIGVLTAVFARRSVNTADPASRRP